MGKIRNAADLKAVIRHTEIRQKAEGPLLKDQVLITYESLKPFNIIKNTCRDLITSLPLKENLLSIALGATAGLVSRSFLAGMFRNSPGKLTGNVLETAVSAIVTQNPELVRSFLEKVIGPFHKAAPSNEETK